jgi:D-amino peptidase
MKKSPARRFHIRCDMEGVSGVVSMDQVTPSAPEYSQARTWFMAEVLALLEGLSKGGATDISVYDEHWFGRNVDLAQVPPGVRVFCGKPPYRADWAGGLDAGTDGLILHGLHAMAGTGHVLSHTYEPEFRAIHLNGRLVGEIGMETAIAGDWSVPLVLIIADSAGVAEARQLVPDVMSVATKISQSSTGAECHALVDTCTAIRAAARQIAAGLPPAEPWRLGPTVTLQCTFHPGPSLDALRGIASAQFVAPDTIVLKGPTATSVWADYWLLKLAAQARLAGGHSTP